MFDRIPQELREYPQWVVWRYETTDNGSITKVPYNPMSGWPASVMNEDHWSTYDVAVHACATHSYSGIGFVLTPHDPFVFIDLDDTKGDELALDRQKRIHEVFNSYSELSPSGRGVHIICKGHVPAGRKRAHVELYGHGRYMTMTGNVLNDAPIAERQAYVDILFNEIGKTYETYRIEGDLNERETDEQIIHKAASAANGDKFNALFKGEWRNLYPSQSEADFALIDILAFYTQNTNQIQRLFLSSGLGQRAKARRIDYVHRMINRSFDRQIPMLDFEGLKNALAAQVAEREAARAQPTGNEGTRAAIAAVQSSAPFIEGSLPPVNNYGPRIGDGPELPPGLVGDLARFMYEAAPRPVADIALMGAIGLMAGICGRAYNVSGTGLNQYMLLLAKTGRGKEAMSSGIDKITNKARIQIPSISNFIGPGDIASGQALIKYMSNTSPSFVSIIGEFDKLLMGLSHQKANSAMIMLRKMILDVFAKSGHGQTYRPMVYSDSSKNTAAILSPAFSILGECTPERFYELLDENLISEGLLPRFMIIEYSGERPALNPNHQTAEPSDILVKQLVSVASASLTLMRGADGQLRVLNIPINDAAKDLLNEFDKFCDSQINEANRDAVAQLWNRAHLKVLKLSGLIAVGINPYAPVIDRDIAAWSMRFIERDVRNMLSLFVTGEIGSDEGKQLTELRKLFSEYVMSDYSKVAKYQVARNIHAAKIIPLRYISMKLLSIACFRKDRLGANLALKRSISILLDQSEIVECNREQLQKEFGTSGKAYVIREMKI